MIQGTLIRVSKAHPCPICHGDHWCRVHSSGRFVICNRVESGEPALGNGWVHRFSAKTKLPPVHTAMAIATTTLRADLTRCDQTYRELLRLLLLSERHHAELQARGMSNDEIGHRGYRSLPAIGRDSLCRLLRDRGCELDGVPGFYQRGVAWTLTGAQGLLIPVRNHQQRIEACKIRLNEDSDGRRYIWLSSCGKPSGASSGAPVHVAQPLGSPQDPRIWITEGPLKADIAAARLNAEVLGLPGVASWREGLHMALELRPNKGVLVVAFDMDFKINPYVARYRDDLILAAGRDGWDVQVAEWNEAKGIDDALVKGKEIKTAPVRVMGRSVPHVRRRFLRKQAILIGASTL